MKLKTLIKKITYIALLEVIMIIMMFALLLLAKAFDIQGGYATKILPFLSILICLFFSFFVIDKKRLNLTFNRLDFLAALLLLIIAVIPAVFDKGILQKLTEGSINYGWLGYYLLVAAAEELFFRAYIRLKLQGLGRKYWIITSAAAFSAIHFISSEKLSVTFFLLIFLFGAVFAITYEIINSILPLIVFHMIWNFMTDISENYSNMLIVISIWAVMLLAAFIIRMLRKRYPMQHKIYINM